MNDTYSKDDLSKKTVKIISQKIEIDWLHPYKNNKPSQAIGSGFFINKEGYIITCSHVIESSNKIFIEIPYLGEERMEVDVVGLCPDFDIALLKTKNYKNKEYYELHDNKKIYEISPGVDVYAIGFPLGQTNLKITKGIISGRQDTKIQTDTPINPGNSGGPLLLNNKVIGINASHIRNASNIGYAIPISYFYLILKELMDKKNKLVQRPFLGFTFQNSNQALLDTFNCKCKSGVFVNNVFKDSPISKSGIKKGDIICKINDISIDNFGLFDVMWFNEKMEFYDILRHIKNNEVIKIQYWRNNRLINKTFKYTDYKLPIKSLYPIHDNIVVDYEIFGGFIVMELTNNHIEIISNHIFVNIHTSSSISKRYNNFLSYLDKNNKDNTKLVITHIFPNSYLKNLKILYDFDIIKNVNKSPCNTLEEYRKNIKNMKSIKNNKYIEIETEINTKAVLSLKHLLVEEHNSAAVFKYKLSNLYTYFMKNSRISKKTKTTQKNKDKDKAKTKNKPKPYNYK